jgi:hypothetical protein
MNNYLIERGFTLNRGLINDGKLTTEAALQSIRGLQQYATSGDLNNSVDAAKNMCYGTPFNPCNILDNAPPPFDINCIRKAMTSLHYSSAGSLYGQTISDWNSSFSTWRALLNKLQWWKNLADRGPSFYGTPSDQILAIQKVYGTTVTFPQLPCVVTTIPQLKVWYDGADPNGDGTLPADGAPVAKWVNKAGFGSYNAMAISPAKYSASKKALFFNGNVYSTNYPANPSNETIFIVFNTPPPPASTNYTSALLSGYTGARGFWVGYTEGNRGSVGILSSDVRWQTTTPANSYTYGTTAMTMGKISGPTSSVTLNGSTTAYTGGTDFNPGTTTFIGQQFGNRLRTYDFVGYAMEIIIFNAALNTSQVQQVEGYLAWKWDLQGRLPSTHPFKNRVQGQGA